MGILDVLKDEKNYASIAQVTYKNGIYTGSFGLPSKMFKAPNLKEAKRIAKNWYYGDNDFVAASMKFKNVKLHISVEEDI